MSWACDSRSLEPLYLIGALRLSRACWLLSPKFYVQRIAFLHAWRGVQRRFVNDLKRGGCFFSLWQCAPFGASFYKYTSPERLSLLGNEISRVRRCTQYGKVAHSSRSGSGRRSNAVGEQWRWVSLRRWEVSCILFLSISCHFFPGSFSAIDQHMVALAEVQGGVRLQENHGMSSSLNASNTIMNVLVACQPKSVSDPGIPNQCISCVFVVPCPNAIHQQHLIPRTDYASGIVRLL